VRRVEEHQDISAAGPNVGGNALLSPFRHRLFLAVWASALVSHFGGQIQGVGASWLMTGLADSAQLVALVATATLIPVLLFSLPFGAMADVYDRRKVLLAGQLIMFSASTILSLVAFTGTITPALLLLLTFAIGSGFALNSPAWQAAVRDFVPKEELPRAISLNILGFQVAKTAGPALGGLIVGAAGPKAAFAVNAMSYLALLAVLFRWRPPPDDNPLPPEPIVAAMGNGIRFVLHAEGVGRIIIRATLFGLFLASMLALLPLVARYVLGGGPMVFGTLLAFGGIGSVIGASSATWLRDRYSPETISRAGQLMVVVAIGIVAISRSVPLSCVAELISGAGMVIAFNSFTVTMQLSVPRWIVGRAMSIYQMGTFGGLALGSWFWGVAAEAIGVPWALGISSICLFISVAAGSRFPLRRPDPRMVEPSGERPRRELDLAEEDASTPVTVAVEYCIEPSDAEAFLDLMRQRRRVILRHGAIHWSLVQDADDRSLWLERFGRASWTDFLRHRDRRTLEEEQTLERVLKLHRAAGPPRVRYFIERDLTAHGAAHLPRWNSGDPRWG
jgi:MFS family permease